MVVDRARHAPRAVEAGGRILHRHRLRAALTVTFGGLKPVHGLADCGRVELIDIGLDLPQPTLLGFEAPDFRTRWPVAHPREALTLGRG